MSILSKVKAAKAAQEKPRYKVRNGKIVVRLYAQLGTPKAPPNKPHQVTGGQVAFRAKMRQEAEREGRTAPLLMVGGQCPKCKGKGRWINPTTGDNGTCYWCNDPKTGGNGKGWLSAKDIAFIQSRDNGAGALNYGLTA